MKITWLYKSFFFHKWMAIQSLEWGHFKGSLQSKR